MRIKNLAVILTMVILFESTTMLSGCADSTSQANEDLVRASTGVSVDENGDPIIPSQNEPTPEPAVATTNSLREEYGKTKVDGLKIKKSIYKNVKLSWKKTPKAKKYEVFRSKKKNSGYTKVKTVSKNYCTDKKAKKKKTYYYKVRAVASIDNLDVCSDYSNSKKVYVKPNKPKTVIVGECFAVALRLEKKNFPSYYRYVAKGGMSTYSILNNNEFKHNGRAVTALEKTALYKPDRVIFLVGANYSGHIDPNKSAKQFAKMYKLMKRINKNIEFVILAVSPWKKDSRYGKKLPSHEKRHQINRAYKKIAKKYKKIYYCNLTEKMEGSNGDLLGKFNSGDGLHWSTTARVWMRTNLKKWLKKKFGTY